MPLGGFEGFHLRDRPKLSFGHVPSGLSRENFRLHGLTFP